MAVRDKDDIEWANVKSIVHNRDKNKCRLCSILTIKEMLIFKKMKFTEKHIDCAHVFPVSNHPAMVYQSDNIYLLCRSHHHLIDDFLSPVTSKRISMNRHYYWWWRIINKSTKEYDKELDYHQIVSDQLNEVKYS